MLGGRWKHADCSAKAAAGTSSPISHVPDTQFGVYHLFGGNGLTVSDRAEDTLFGRMHHDLAYLASEHGLRPDPLVVTGDLAEWGLRS